MNIKSVIIFIFFATFQIFSQEKVLRIIDGDTFELFSGEKVRLIGINSPELKDKFGYESKEYLVNLIKTKEIILKTDSLTKNKDIYGRLLRYVYLGEEDINKKMILDGYAVAYLKYSFKKIEEYKQAERFAKNKKNGFWSIDKSIAFEKNSKTKYIILGSGILILLSYLIYFLKK
ncbi:MAG: thermonuclease family protein [Ignavibacterium sp.]